MVLFSYILPHKNKLCFFFEYANILMLRVLIFRACSAVGSAVDS